MAAEAAYELELEAVLRVMRKAFISVYCVVVVAAN